MAGILCHITPANEKASHAEILFGFVEDQFMFHFEDGKVHVRAECTLTSIMETSLSVHRIGGRPWGLRIAIQQARDATRAG